MRRPVIHPMAHVESSKVHVPMFCLSDDVWPDEHRDRFPIGPALTRREACAEALLLFKTREAVPLFP